MEALGRGYATEAASALTRVAFEVDRVDRVEIHCDPANTRSARIPYKLGYRFEATLRKRRLGLNGDMRDSMIWSLSKDEYAGSAATRVGIKAFDVVGRELPIAPPCTDNVDAQP